MAHQHRPQRSATPDRAVEAHAGAPVARLSGRAHELEEHILERRGIAAMGVRPQLGEGALGDQATRLDHADPLGHPLGHVQDVRRQDHRPAARDMRVEQVLRQTRGLGVESGQRLVEDQQAGVADQRTGQHELLSHAAREGLATLRRMRHEAERVEQPGRFGACVRGVHVPQRRDQLQVLDRRQLVVQHRFVGHVRDDPLGLLRRPGQVDAEDRDCAAVGREQAGDHPQRGGLARAVRAEQRIELAGRDGEVEAVDRGAVRSGEVLLQLRDLERRRHRIGNGRERARRF